MQEIGPEEFANFQQRELHEMIPQDQTVSGQNTGCEYTTYVNELISEPEGESMSMAAANYILSSLYELSSYLFRKKVKRQDANDDSSSESKSFQFYLNSMGQQLGRYERVRLGRGVNSSSDMVNMESELVKCYQKVDSIYFEERFFLDFSYFQLLHSEIKAFKNADRIKVNHQLDKLIQNLDLVEINLFSQIHSKFHQYFTVAANFDYLHDSIKLQLGKIAESRKRVKAVKRQYVEKSVNLRKIIVQRQNIEKVLKYLKTIKSLKKLPLVIESILASALPYECLDLLQQTKGTVNTVKQLKCLSHTSNTIRQMEVLAQNDLNKRYANELYIYLEQCHTKQNLSLNDIWRKIQVGSCLDKDSSLIIDELNSSSLSSSGFSNRSSYKILEELDNIEKGNERAALSHNIRAQRDEGKEYEIAMILIQSYQHIQFSANLTKIKVCNALRMFSKRFEKQLLVYLDSVIKQEIENRTHHKTVLTETVTQTQPIPPIVTTKKSINQNEIEDKAAEIIEKISIQFYIKHVGVLNDIFKQTINRFLGYLHTVIIEYEEELWRSLDKGETEQNHVIERHKKFKILFGEECSLLPSIFKIVQEKIKHLLTLKNISSIDSMQFYRWISTLKFWQKYFDYLIEQHPLVNYHGSCPSGQEPEVGLKLIGQLVDTVFQNVRQSMSAMGLESLLYDLTVNYIDSYHQNTLKGEIINSLQGEAWTSVEIPPQFSQILSSILSGGSNQNASLTILDSSTSRNSSRDISRGQVSREEGRSKIKFKILKNNILVSGVRLKVNLSLMLLCEFIAEYLKIARMLGHVLRKGQEDGQNKITRYMYQKLFDMINKYCSTTHELILEAKALQYQKIKKSINAKHICLLFNCLSLILSISEVMIDQEKLRIYELQERKKSTQKALEQHQEELLGKLSSIINAAIQKKINDFLSNERNGTPQSTTKTSNQIVSSFLQMIEITAEYLEEENVKKILKNAFQTVTQKFLMALLEKGGKFKSEAELLTQKLNFLRKYFRGEFEALAREIST